MTNHKEILRLKSLGLSDTEVASSCGCGRNTVTRVLQRAAEAGLTWASARGMTEAEISEKLFPRSSHRPLYRMPDYERIHYEMQKSGVTLSLLWAEYCEQCRTNGEIPYQSAQFNKYYSEICGYVREIGMKRSCSLTAPNKRDAAKSTLAVFYVLLVFLPLIVMLANITPESIRSTVASPNFFPALCNSVVAASITTVITVVLAYLLAYCTQRIQIRGKMYWMYCLPCPC